MIEVLEKFGAKLLTLQLGGGYHWYDLNVQFSLDFMMNLKIPSAKVYSQYSQHLV